MNALPGVAQCIPSLISPWLNEDVTNGLIETRSCGGSNDFGNNKAHGKWLEKETPAEKETVEKHEAMKEKEKSLLLLEIAVATSSTSSMSALQRNGSKKSVLGEEEEEIQRSAAERIHEPEENNKGRCVPVKESKGSDEDCTKFQNEELCVQVVEGSQNSMGGIHCVWGPLLVEEKVVFPKSTLDVSLMLLFLLLFFCWRQCCLIFANRFAENFFPSFFLSLSLLFLVLFLLPNYHLQVRDYALEEEELKSNKQLALEKECNVPYHPSTDDGGYDPLVLANEGFSK